MKYQVYNYNIFNNKTVMNFFQSFKIKNLFIALLACAHVNNIACANNLHDVAEDIMQTPITANQIVEHQVTNPKPQIKQVTVTHAPQADIEMKSEESIEHHDSKIAKQILNLQKAQEQIKKHEEFMTSLPETVKKELEIFATKMQQIISQRKDLESKLSNQAKEFFIKDRQYKSKIALISYSKTEDKLSNIKEMIMEYKNFLQTVPQNVKDDIDEYRSKSSELYKIKTESLNILSSKAKGALKRDRIIRKIVGQTVNGKTNKYSSKNKK